MRVPKNHRFKNQWLYEPLIVWNVIFEPPVIFYTLSNKRQGIFPVKKRNILSELKLPRTQWLCIPINVGRMLFYIYVHMEFLALGAGVTNLFEIADMKEVMTKKPDGIVIFGVPEEMIGDDEKRGAVFIDEEENMIVGVIPFSPENDYFGYMKKNTLTVHNLKVIEKGNLPVHGALARVRLVNGKSSYILLVGDSGAGKSETLEALNRYQEVSMVDIIFDDMGSLEIHDGKVVAFGTEVGAFVRLDDLPPGYAYSTIDRSVFMNPDSVNARVIVPFNNFSEIIKPSRIDYVFYANNYTKVSEGEDEIRFFKNVDEALEVFSKGARMAKGTTHERGITTSYFANPFGAIQMREKHHEIAIKFFNQMFKTGIKIGELKTSLGIPGYEYEGPLRAAKRLIKLINEGK
jgi:energy-coupling factor transporter ATP-binding protein EcfA2